MKTFASRKTLLCVSLLIFSTLIFAQGGPGPPPPPAAVPLDPLSWVVLAAGGGIAGKKYFDLRKKK